ncbi:MAG: photosystem II biogenesis protein Psp29 [Symploca sp. SIO3C6]|uniref:Protein Thf1 n=1 Tax=Symploca sp. SIO1C4 TaxID=2607765 RepID=A0A6B3NJX4_9CYAN|nr:photosystem II biogenesis protein Psp29 [Symploca sp. SIO3C6]NER31165.1 photosystem II biogenesis protein Psp29 [Symploca sp. SIO1C4]
MNNPPTVSDTKRGFYSHHTRPVNSIYRRVVEELMVEMHLLSVNTDFRYDPIYALGVVTAFDRLMQGYQPEQDKESIFNALCLSVGAQPQQYRQDAQRLEAMASSFSFKDLLSWFNSPTSAEGLEDLHAAVAALLQNPKFKYSRLFAIGIYTLLEKADSSLVKDEKQCKEALTEISNTLNLPVEKLQKDLELYRSNLAKMEQAQSVMADVIEASRKKRQQQSQEKQESEQNNQTPTPAGDSQEDSANPEEDEAPSA